jgi:hypothetical protein
MRKIVDVGDPDVRWGRNMQYSFGGIREIVPFSHPFLSAISCCLRDGKRGVGRDEAIVTGDTAGIERTDQHTINTMNR